jgi:hypothetical protein
MFVGKVIWIWLLFLPIIFTACWIPLPRETAIVVQVLEGADPTGIPIEDVDVIIDGQSLITREDGTVFQSFTTGGAHNVQVDAASLVDPQGGIRWTLLGSRISGESPEGSYLAYADRGFAFGDTAMAVPVQTGFITAVTIYVSQLQASPVDNQWVTDGRAIPSSPYRSLAIDEFDDPILPVFWWRQEPSLGNTVNFIFQLWQDTDGDTRFPLGVVDASDYASVMASVPPDWQVPLSGLQKATAVPGSASEVQLLSGAALDDVDGANVTYDVYYAQTPFWDNNQWENNNIIRNVLVTQDSGAVRSDLSFSTPGFTTKNGVQYTFGLRAQDTSANMDTLFATNTSNATPVSGNTPLGTVNNLSVLGSPQAGKVDFQFDGRPVSTEYRVYAGPSAARTYEEKYVRKIFTGPANAVTGTLTGLVNGTTYYIGVEPFAANNDVGVAGSPIQATPLPAGDSTAPTWDTGGFINVSMSGAGAVQASWDSATDLSSPPVTYRLYHGVNLSSSDAGARATGIYAFIDTTATTVDLQDLVNNVAYEFDVRAIDSVGNATAPISTTLTLSSLADTTGPIWTTSDQSPQPLFTSINWSNGPMIYPLGWVYSYNGFGLSQNPNASPPEGEYVWRVIQDDGSSPPVQSKLGAFYTYNGYYYWSGESGALKMSNVSSNVDHEQVFTFMEVGLPPLAAPSLIMGTPLDASPSQGRSYLQRPASEFTGLLSSNTVTDPDFVNQMIIRYDTNLDGEATNVQFVPSGNGAFLRSLVMNRKTSLALDPPYLQYKGFGLTYSENVDNLVPFPGAIDPVLFFGTLANPDFEDPELAP